MSAKLTRGCGENAAETNVNAASAASGQKKRGTSMRSRRHTTSASQHAMAIASSACAAAIENWSVAATPKMAASPACSSRRGDDGPSCAAISVASAWSMLEVILHRSCRSGSRLRACLCQRAFGGLDHLLRLNPGQASEVPGQARSLIARAAREIGDFDRLRRPDRRAPRRRPRRQVGPYRLTIGTWLVAAICIGPLSPPM